jgi:hypothetical protein
MGATRFAGVPPTTPSGHPFHAHSIADGWGREKICQALHLPKILITNTKKTTYLRKIVGIVVSLHLLK